MKEQDFNRNTAAEKFLRLLIDAAYEGAVERTLSLLRDGPPGRTPQPVLLELHQWFQNQDAESQKLVERIVREAAYFSVFETLVLFDGASGTARVQGRPLDFALCLQIYPDEDALWDDSPEFSIRVNPLEKDGEELHDMFQAMVEDPRNV